MNMNIRFKCKKCGQVFLLDKLKVTKKYCDNCRKINNNILAKQIKNNYKEQQRRQNKNNSKLEHHARWIINDENTITCNNCGTITIPKNLEYDKWHGEIICRKCGLIVGVMEVW